MYKWIRVRKLASFAGKGGCMNFLKFYGMYTHLSTVIYVVLSTNVYEWSTVLTVYSQSHTILANVYMQVPSGTMPLHHMACIYILANFPLTWEIALFGLALVYSFIPVTLRLS